MILIWDGVVCCAVMWCGVVWYDVACYIDMVWWPRLAQSRFWLICRRILIGNERKFASVGSEQILVDLLMNSIGNERKLASAGSEEILVVLLLNSNR